MSNQGEHFSITALQNCKLLILTGQPIAEPINGHGPFVMNTYDEILQAYDDIKMEDLPSKTDQLPHEKQMTVIYVCLST